MPIIIIASNSARVEFEMRIASVIVIISVICGSFFNNITALPTIFNNRPQINNEIYDAYLSISDKQSDNSGDELDLLASSHRRQVYLHHPKFIRNNIEPKKLGGDTYLVVNRMQRDKRYISYLQLCHFKICNMGRKRSARYFHMIRKLDDNES